MTKVFASLILVSIALTACSTPDSVILTNQNQANTLNATKPVKNGIDSKTINTEFAKQIAMALDLNKDGSVDASEAPISLSSSTYTTNIYNSDNSSINGYIPTKAIPVSTIADRLSSGFELSVCGSKTSEKNKSKISAALGSVLVKDSIAEGNKAYGFSTTVGYFTAKTTIMVRNMDSSLLAKRINDQITVGKGTINGNPYQGANGSINVMPSYVTIDGKYKSRLRFSDYDEFNSGIQLIGSHKITDAAKKIVK